MVRCSWLLLVGAAGCNAVFGISTTDLKATLDAAPPPDGDPRIDLDQDGIKDVEDSCIAPDTDALVDSDGDGMRNGVDPCPLDMRPTGDADQDGIGDNCDPSPRAERTRCIMAFTDPELTVDMWRTRDGSDGWELFHPRLLWGRTAGSIVADWSFEAPDATTYSIYGQLYSSASQFIVLARGARESNADDVGCRFVSGTAWSLAASQGATATLGPAPGGAVPFRLQMTVAPRAVDGFTLRCTAQLGTGPVATSETAIPLPQGTLGFVAVPTAVVRGVVVYESADAQ